MRALANRPLREISETEIAQAARESGVSDDLRAAVVQACASARSSEQPTIAAAGAQNLLDQPEFQDLRKLRSILRIVEEQKTLYQFRRRRHERGDGQRQDRPRARRRRAGRSFGRNGSLSVRFARDRNAFHPGAAADAVCALCSRSLRERPIRSQRTSLGRQPNTRRVNMPTKDYYDILGVGRDATGDEIKRAYRKLAREHHPDVADDKSRAEHHFKEINEAYEVLSDPRKRAQYDRFGTVGNGAGAGDFGFGSSARFGDIFDMFFGNARGAHSGGAAAGARFRSALRSRDHARRSISRCDERDRLRSPGAMRRLQRERRASRNA